MAYEWLSNISLELVQYSTIFTDSGFNCKTSIDLLEEGDLQEIFGDRNIPFGHLKMLKNGIKNKHAAVEPQAQQIPVPAVPFQEPTQQRDAVANRDLQTAVPRPEMLPLDRMNEEMENEMQVIKDQRRNLTQQLNDLQINVPPLPMRGRLQNTICGMCHHSGHRNTGCAYAVCPGYHACGHGKKHPEYMKQISNINDQLKNLANLEKQVINKTTVLQGTRQNDYSMFFRTLRPRLRNRDPQRYSVRGHLDTDLLVLYKIYKGKLPSEEEDVGLIDKIKEFRSRGDFMPY